jgi:hypothetical protein
MIALLHTAHSVGLPWTSGQPDKTRSPYLFYLLTVGRRGSFYFHLITLRHTTQSVGLLWTRDRPVAETSTWQHKHSQETNIHAPAGFEPTIPASQRTGIGMLFSYNFQKSVLQLSRGYLWNASHLYCDT